MTTTFLDTLNSFCDYMEYDFQSELALHHSHLNLPERIQEIEIGDAFILNREQMKKLSEKYKHSDLSFMDEVAFLCSIQDRRNNNQ